MGLVHVEEGQEAVADPWNVRDLECNATDATDSLARNLYVAVVDIFAQLSADLIGRVRVRDRRQNFHFQLLISAGRRFKRRELEGPAEDKSGRWGWVWVNKRGCRGRGGKNTCRKGRSTLM